MPCTPDSQELTKQEVLRPLVPPEVRTIGTAQIRGLFLCRSHDANHGHRRHCPALDLLTPSDGVTLCTQPAKPLILLPGQAARQLIQSSNWQTNQKHHYWVHARDRRHDGASSVSGFTLPLTELAPSHCTDSSLSHEPPNQGTAGAIVYLRQNIEPPPLIPKPGHPPMGISSAISSACS